jgi:hypothetical protein
MAGQARLNSVHNKPTMRTLWLIPVKCLLLLAATVAGADETKAPDLLKDAQRVVFLGDSITAAGQYVAYVDAWIVAQRWETSPQLINCGLPSETGESAAHGRGRSAACGGRREAWWPV